MRAHCHTHLHERDEQEEGVGRPPDLLIQEPGQKGEYAIFGGTAAKDTKTNDFKKTARVRVKCQDMQSDFLNLETENQSLENINLASFPQPFNLYHWRQERVLWETARTPINRRICWIQKCKFRTKTPRNTYKNPLAPPSICQSTASIRPKLHRLALLS